MNIRAQGTLAVALEIIPNPLEQNDDFNGMDVTMLITFLIIYKAHLPK
jgi:hypothetical protein